MRSRDVRGLVLGLAVAALALVGCTKPTPAVTVQSGDTSLRSEAENYQLDGRTVTNRAGAKVLTVRPGDNVNLSVDKHTEYAGWVGLLGGQKISPLLTHDQHTFSFQAPGFNGGSDASLAIFQQP